MTVDVREGVAVIVCVAVGVVVGVRVISVKVRTRVGVIMTSGVGVVEAAATGPMGVDVRVGDGVTDAVGVMLGVDETVGVEVGLEVGLEVRVGVSVSCWALPTWSGSVRKLAMIKTTSAHSSATRPSICTAECHHRRPYVYRRHNLPWWRHNEDGCGSRCCGWLAATCA